MKQPQIFEYSHDNNSLTTLAQHKLISKLAGHFGLSAKLVRSHLNLDSLAKGVIDPRLPEYPVSHTFTCTSIKLKLTDLIYPKKLIKSAFLFNHSLMTASLHFSDVPLFVVACPDLYILDAVDNVPNNRGVGGIYLNYPVHHIVDSVLLPFASWLDAKYPHPLD